MTNIPNVRAGWNKVFNIDLRCFTSKEIRPNRNKGQNTGYDYTFHYMIKTDGIFLFNSFN
jgi:hypothetical protein